MIVMIKKTKKTKNSSLSFPNFSGVVPVLVFRNTDLHWGFANYDPRVISVFIK